ncbi:MAG: outer membrane lipoprotein carrier protein LolA [Deltaproteobacteria bacterium]|nr:outer membrane lipoprotein carrier protein LolA [Deltaproteobacteria bacterium]
MATSKGATMRIARSAVCSLVLVSALGADAARAQDAGVRQAALIDRIEAARRGLRTVVGEFVQRKQMALFATTIETRGRIVVRMPDRLRWETVGQDAAVYLVAGDRLAYRSAAGSGEVRASQAGAMGAVVRDLASILGGSLRALGRRYELREEAGSVLVVVPRDPGVRRSLVRMRVTFGGARLLPSRMELEEPGGDRTVIEVRNLRVNVAVPERELRLE